MDRDADRSDPRGLIYEAYQIAGIGDQDCRTIFFDWALGLPDDLDANVTLRALHDRYAPQYPEHPMTAVLANGFSAKKPADRPRRRKSRL